MTLFDGRPDHAKRTRKPNPLWDAIAAEFFGGQIPPAYRTRVGRAAKAIAEFGGQPGDIAARKREWPRVFAGCVCTLEALVKHWHLLADTGPRLRGSHRERDDILPPLPGDSASTGDDLW